MVNMDRSSRGLSSRLKANSPRLFTTVLLKCPSAYDDSELKSHVCALTAQANLAASKTTAIAIRPLKIRRNLFVNIFSPEYLTRDIYRKINCCPPRLRRRHRRYPAAVPAAVPGKTIPTVAARQKVRQRDAEPECETHAVRHPAPQRLRPRWPQPGCKSDTNFRFGLRLKGRYGSSAG